MTRHYYEVQNYERRTTTFHAEDGEHRARHEATHQFMQATILSEDELRAMMKRELDNQLDDAIAAQKVWEREVAKYKAMDTFATGKSFTVKRPAQFVPVTSELLEDEAAIKGYINERLRNYGRTLDRP